MPNLTFAIGGIWPFFGGKKGSIENKPMARAKRHYIPGQIWHLTHRCHKREFLLKFEKDRRRWMHWLFQAKKRYGLNILDYVVTSNHIHLLVVGDNKRDVIPNSIKLAAGRTGQELKNSAASCRESPKCKETGDPPKGWGVGAKRGQI